MALNYKVKLQRSANQAPEGNVGIAPMGSSDGTIVVLCPPRSNVKLVPIMSKRTLLVRKQRVKAGRRLRGRRLELGLTLREVHNASLRLARIFHNPAFVISCSRLHSIETRQMVPKIHRLYTLAHIYKRRLHQLLSWYGIPPRQGGSD